MSSTVPTDTCRAPLRLDVNTVELNSGTTTPITLDNVMFLTQLVEVFPNQPHRGLR